MRTSTKLGSLTAVAALTASLFAGSATAAARPQPVLYVGLAGGSVVTLLDGTVSSGYTAPSVIQGSAVPNSDDNNIAATGVPGVVDTGVITTSSAIAHEGVATSLTSHAETANVSLLGGLITADAVDTTSTTTFTGTAFETNSSTEFVNLKISNITLPINIARNFTVTIPGVATVVLNSSTAGRTASSASSIGAGVYITLLAGIGTSPLGTKVLLNPTYSAVTTHIPNTPVILGGSAYATDINASVLGIDVGVRRTAFQSLPASGTGGDVVTNSTAGVSLPGLLTTGVVTTTVRGVATNTTGDAQTTAAIAGINLFNGLIKAKAVKAIARVTLTNTGHIALRHTSTLVGLRIAGQRIPIKVAPNTHIDVAGLGTVYLNQQSSTSFSTNVRALYVVVTTAGLGLPVGATVAVGVAGAYILS